MLQEEVLGTVMGSLSEEWSAWEVVSHLALGFMGGEQRQITAACSKCGNFRNSCCFAIL